MKRTLGLWVLVVLVLAAVAVGQIDKIVIAAGTPEEVAGVEKSYTGQFMKKVLGGQ